MKKIIKNKFLIVFLLIVCAAFAAFGLSFTAQPASADAVDDNYRFDKISTEITVNTDKTFNVTETLQVNFLRSNINTGIIRDIQRISKTTRVIDGKQKDGGSYIAGLSDVSVTFDGGDCKVTQSLYNSDQYYSVKMQQPTGYIEAGVHTFVLSYVYDMHDDKISGVDDFTFDVLGYAMAFTNEFEAKITFPEDADLSNVTFRTNNKKAWTPSGEEYAAVAGNVISLKAFPQSKNVGYTVQVILPDGYFTAQKTFYWYYAVFAALAAAATIALVVIVLTHLPKKPLETVEFYPPEGMTVMRFASIWRMGAKRKDTAAVILKWASLGIISIAPNGSRDCILKANLNPEKEYKEGVKLSKRLVKPAEECFGTAIEEAYFNVLFSGIGGDGFTFSTSHFLVFATPEQERQLYRLTNDLVEEGDTEPTKSFVSRQKLRTATLFAGLVPTVAIVAYFCILNFSLFPFMFIIFMVVGNVPVLSQRNMRNPIAYIFPIVFYGLPYAMLNMMFALTAYDYCGLLYIAPVIWVLGLALRFFIPDKRAPEVMLDYGKMLGFKTFLLKAELPRIQALFDENPFYFADILPYCLIMGISDKVQKRFEPLNIRVPDYMAQGLALSVLSASIIRSSNAGAPRSSGSSGGGGFGGSSGGGGGGGGSRGC